MNRRLARFVRLVTLPALLALGVLSAPAASAGNPCFHGYEMPPSTTGSGTDVKLMPCAFVPTVTVIDVGQSVTFINGPDYTHLVTGAGHEWGSAEVEVQPNETVTYAFDAGGVYPYACALHPGMSGAIVVGDLADAVAVGSSNSTGGTTATTGAIGADDSKPTATDDASLNSSVLAGLGIGAGLVAGAAVAWIVLRRRPAVEPTFVRAE